MKKDEIPAMRLIRLEEDMAKYKPEKPELSKDNIKSFVQDFIDGKLKVSNEKASDTLSPANYFSLIQTIKSFSISSTAGSLLLVRDFTPFATSAALMASLLFSMVDIVDLAIPYWTAKSNTHVPFSHLVISSFFSSTVVIMIFLLGFSTLVTFFGATKNGYF